MLYMIIIMISLVIVIKLRQMYKRYIINDLMVKYPVYGDVNVILVNKQNLVDSSSNVKGTFDRVNREINIAMYNPLNNIIDSYLHEMRHSQQCFSNDFELKQMYLQSVSVLNYLKGRVEDEFDAYWNSEHEVDAREYAKRVTEEYLATR